MRLLVGLAIGAMISIQGGDTLAQDRSSSNIAALASRQLAMPRFRFEIDWLKLPSDLVMGEISAVAVDSRDHVWVLHRPKSASATPPARIASPIAEFDARGRYLRGFGGPGDGYEWPGTEHSLAVAANGDVWVGGSSRAAAHGDDMLLVFDRKGRFLRQFGRRGANKGNLDTANFNAPADIYVDQGAHEVYVADGYGNQRLIVIGERDGRFRRMWGAFGLAPPPSGAITGAIGTGDQVPATFDNVHGVEMSRDGTIYVSDRGHQRIQAFTRSGRFLREVVVNRGLTSPRTASGMALSRDRDQKYMFVADWGNGMMVVVDRKAMKVIGTIGQRGSEPGQFKGPHLIDIDSKGVIYVAEVEGRRVQRLVPADSKK